MADILTYDDEQLVVITVEERNWRGIGISLLVIAGIFSLIALAIFLLTPPHQIDYYGEHRLDLKEILNNAFKPKPFKIQWISPSKLLYHQFNGTVTLLDLNRNFSSNTLIHYSIINRLNIENIRISPNHKLILLQSACNQHLAYTQTSEYYIYNVSTEAIFSLKEHLLKSHFEKNHLITLNSSFYKQEYLNSNWSILNLHKELLKNIHLQYADWGPNETNLILIVNNDIFLIENLIDLDTPLKQITFNGSPFLIFNGIPNWTYSKFISNLNYRNVELGYDLSMSSIWWSPNGQMFAFLTFNDTLVNKNKINFYSSLNENIAFNEEPFIQTIRYPLAGQNNPSVVLTIVRLSQIESKHHLIINAPYEIINLDYYLVNLKWTQNNDIFVVYTLRSLNQTLISLCKQDDAFRCKIILQLNNPSLSLLELSSMMLNLDKSSSQNKYFIKIKTKDSSNEYFSHIASFKLKNSYLNYHTYGRFDVTKLLAYHSSSRTLYFQGTKLNEIHSRHIYSLKLSKFKLQTNQLTCLTCRSNEKLFHNEKNSNEKQSDLNITLTLSAINKKIKDTSKWIINCENFDASFSPDFKYFVLNCAGPTVPYFELWSNENQTFQNVYLKLITPPPPTKEEQEKAEEEEIEIVYPIIIESISLDMFNVTIENRFQIGWPHYLASKCQFIYAQIAIRNSIQTDDKSEFLNNLKLDLNHKINSSNKNLLDFRAANRNFFDRAHFIGDLFRYQLKIIHYLIDNFSNIDRKRIMIYGWGSSAYTALATLAKDDLNLINAAIAIAPIVNWRSIDSITAEHNLGLPSNLFNFAQYEKINLLNFKSSLIKKKFLIIHGTADEKIFVQHTMQLAKLMITSYDYKLDGEINYQIQLYPDECHFIPGSRQHMFTLINNYINKFFSPHSYGETFAT